MRSIARAERSRRQRARAVPQEGPSDAERQAERELDRREVVDLDAVPAAAHQRHAARVGRVHVQDILIGNAEGRRGVLQRRRRLRDVPFARPAISPASPRASPRPSICSSACSFRAARARPRARGGRAEPERGHGDDHAGSGPAAVRRARRGRRFLRHVPRRATAPCASSRKAPGVKVVDDRSAAGAPRSARPHHRQEHPRSRGLPGDPEMRRGRRAHARWRCVLRRRRRSAAQRRR